MIPRVKGRLYAGFAAAIVLVLVIGAIAFAAFHRQTKEAGLVKHTYEVINQLVVLQKLLTDMETGQRGFRSTGEGRFLQPYLQGLQHISPAIKRLQYLIADNSAQQQMAANVETGINSITGFWSNLTIKTSYSKEEMSSITLFEKTTMDNIRAQIDEMMLRENRLLKTREYDNNASVKQAKWQLAVGVLLILVIVFLLVYQTLREFNNRKRAEDRLKKKLAELTAAMEQNDEQNWVLAGIVKVNGVLQEQTEIAVLAGHVLNTLIKYTDARAGAFYIYDDEPGKLVMAASVALTGKEKQAYALHEGFVGQAAAEKEMLLISGIAAGYTTIAGGTAEIKPAAALYLPLCYQGTLKAVIEILSFENISDKQLRLLKVVDNNIGVAIQSVQAKDRMLLLLQQVRQQKEVLENQQEELRQTNEQLVAQAEELQSSEEELRVQEEELRQANSELEEKNKDVEAAKVSLMAKAKELEAASRYKSEFLANMSHELRTPLNSILILSKLLSDNIEKNFTEKQVSYASLIHKAGSDLLQLINEILDLAKIEAGKAAFVSEQVAIKTIATNMEELFAVVAESNQIHYHVSIEAEVPATITSDRQKIEQVLKNLLSNAFKFTRKGGEVSLLFSVVKNELAITVSDNGIGIPKQKQQIIFNAFEQADNSTSRRFGGTGLGLSITKELMKILNGRVEVKSEENKGSSFTIFIPADAVPVSKNPATYAEQPHDAAPTNNPFISGRAMHGSEKTILIIEDDETFASVISDFAVSNGYKAIIAGNGDDGLHLAQQHKPSAIILDMLLPGIDGAELLKIFKSDPDLKDIPVHIISALEDAKSVSAGALSVLKKPVDKEDLDAAFYAIEKYLQAALQKVMVLSQEGSLADEIESKIQPGKAKKIQIDRATTVAEALEKLGLTDYDCIIAETGNDLQESISQLTALSKDRLQKRVPTIIYISHDITPAGELELKRISDVIIRKSSLSSGRLIDEMGLFLNKVREVRKEPVTDVTPHVASKVLKDKKVLLVDDDMRNIFALTALLEQEQMQVVTANDGKEALEVLHSDTEINIVLMDIMMPEMDGYDAMMHIRNNSNLAGLPIIALTAKAMAGDKEKCIMAGASDFITKPVDTGKLVSLMKLWLS